MIPFTAKKFFFSNYSPESRIQAILIMIPVKELFG